MAVRAAKFGIIILVSGVLGLAWCELVAGEPEQLPARPVGEYPTEAPPLPPHAVLQPSFPPPFSTIPPPDLPSAGVPDLPPPPAASTDPFLPQPRLEPELILPDGRPVPLPASSRQQIRFSPRYQTLPQFIRENLGNGELRQIVTGGVIVNVVYLPANPGEAVQEIEFATDNVVAWTRGISEFGPTRVVDTQVAQGKPEIEIFLSGDVVIRTLSPGRPGVVEQVLRAEQIYYDVTRNRAVALNADLEVRGSNLLEPVHLSGAEVWRLGRNEWRAFEARTFSSKRPSDPNLSLTTPQATLTQQYMIRRNIFGMPYRNLLTGQTEVGYERTLTTRLSALRIRGVPILPLPPSKADLDEPFGPLMGFGTGNDQIFGTQIYTTWDIYKLLALRPPPGHRWRLDVDYLSDRGPALGTMYNYAGSDFLGLGQQHAGFIRLYGIQDGGVDQLGSDRPEVGHPEYRGRAQFRHNQDLYEYGTTFLRLVAQAEYLSDKNFLEQYYKQEFDMGPNQDSFLHLFGATENWYGSALLQGKISQEWFTITEWLPRFDAALVGETFLRDRFIYSATASAGYAQLRPATVLPLPVLVSNAIPVNTGRFDLQQELSAPFDLGPFRIKPYGMLDLTYYSDDLTGQDNGRVYGGGGATVSTTVSRLYQEAYSELLNLRGLYHKVTISGNYFNARSDTRYYQLPQLDPLFDNAVDEAFRNAPPTPGIMYPPGVMGTFMYPNLGYSPSLLFNPQFYAIRRLVNNRIDTRDSMEVLQLEGRQRLQTKRGFPGAEHTIDWMTLNTSVSFFPNADRDNYGSSWAFLEYFYLWHLGDRFSITSSGWFDPFTDGARYFNVGLNFNRPDNTNFFVSYRHTDPLNSRAVTAAINYQLSHRYAMNLGTAYDFGINESLTNSISFARTGPDMTLVLGFTYNPLVNNFGVQFSLIPNVAGIGFGQGLGGGPALMAGR